MKSTEENALMAVLDDEEVDAKELIAQLLPSQRARLAKAARRLAGLCEADGASDRRDSKMIGVAFWLVFYAVVMGWIYVFGKR